MPYKNKIIYDKTYYEENKDKINDKKRLYRQENKEKFKEKDKLYYEKNKDIINEKAKIYREENKDKIDEHNSKPEVIEKRKEYKNKPETKQKRKEYNSRLDVSLKKDMIQNQKYLCLGCARTYNYNHKKSHFISSMHIYFSKILKEKKPNHIEQNEHKEENILKETMFTEENFKLRLDNLNN
jgi:hypothetical protein